MNPAPFFTVRWMPLNNPSLLAASVSSSRAPFFTVRWRPTLGLVYYPFTVELRQTKKRSRLIREDHRARGVPDIPR